MKYRGDRFFGNSPVGKAQAITGNDILFMVEDYKEIGNNLDFVTSALNALTVTVGNFPVNVLTKIAGENYLSQSGITITANPVNLATSNVTGNLPVTHLNSGTSASNTTFWRGDGIWGTPVGLGGTVTNVSSADANATVANPTTTPVITIVAAPKLTTARNINGVAFDGTANITITSTASNALTIGTGLTGTSYNGSAPVTILITATTVTASSYGSATQSPTFTVNAQGQITAAANVTIAPAFSSITATPITIAGYGITDAYTKTASDARYFQIGNNLSEGTAATMRTNIGATTVGGNFLTLANPSAITFIKINADNSISTRTASQMLADIGGISGNQTITLSGNVTGSGTTAITTTIAAGVVTNAMLAGNISDANLATSYLKADGSRALTADWTTGEFNLIFGTTTGTKIGTATTQKLSFYNSTPIVQPTGSIITGLSNLGLVRSPTLQGSELTLSDVTTNNVSTSNHGFFPKLTSNSVYYVDNSGALTALALGANGTVLTSAGATSIPTFSAAGAGTVTSVTSADANATVATTTTTPVITIVSAPKLATARTINGTSFDGTANITVTADANTLTNTTLHSTVVTSSLTSVGVIGTGTWQGTIVGGTYGGTGVNNGSSTITIGGNVTVSGAFTTTVTVTANTSVTLPTSGTLVNTAVTTLSSLVSIGTVTTGVWNATKIGLVYGGTNVDLSGTGGTSQVLQQTSVGGNITVGQLAVADLSTAKTGTGSIVLATAPTLTNPVVGTQTKDDNSIKAGSTAYVDSKQLYNYYIYNALGSVIAAENFPVQLATSNTNPTSQGVYYMAVWLPKAMTLTGVKWFQRTAFSGTSSNYNGIGLCTYSGGTMTQVASSTDDGTIWKTTSLTYGSKAFSSTYVAAAGLYYIEMVYSSSAVTTPPALGSAVIFGQAATTTLDFTNSAKLNGVLASQTAFPSSQAMSGVATTTNQFWFALY